MEPRSISNEADWDLNVLCVVDALHIEIHMDKY